MSIPKMSIPKMSTLKMSIPIMSTVPKCLFPLCLLCKITITGKKVDNITFHECWEKILALKAPITTAADDKGVLSSVPTHGFSSNFAY